MLSSDHLYSVAELRPDIEVWRDCRRACDASPGKDERPTHTSAQRASGRAHSGVFGQADRNVDSADTRIAAQAAPTPATRITFKPS